MIGYGCSGIYFMHLAGIKIKNTLKIIIQNFLIFLPAGLLLLLAKILDVNSNFVIILAALLLLVYFGYLVKTDATIRGILSEYRILKRV